jgi:hypothetical protein
MSSEHKPPDDLPHDEDVSRAWMSTQATQPPSKLDDAVLKFARESQVSVRRRRRWQAPLAVAAVVTLGVGVVLQLWREPQVQAPQPMRSVLVPAASVTSEADNEKAEISRQTEAMSRKREAAAEREMQRSAERAEARERVAPPPPAAAPELSIVAPSMAMRSYAAVAAAPQPNESTAWQAATFHDLSLATATREQVRAKFGVPSSSEGDRVDQYKSLPEFAGTAAFRYDEKSRLIRATLQPEKLEPASKWVEKLGLHEPALQRASDWACNSNEPETIDGVTMQWLYPTRGTWLVLDAEQRVLRVNYAARCD